MPFAAGSPSQAGLPNVLPGNQIGSLGSVADSTVVGNVYSEYDPMSILRLAFRRHGKRPGFAQMLDALGPDFNSGVNAPVTGHYEVNNWVGQMIKIGDIDDPSGGAGNSMDIELDTDNMTDPGIEVGGSTGYSSNVRKNDLILLPGGSLAFVSDKGALTDNPHIITITPFDSTIDLDAIVMAGDTYAIVTNAHARASDLPEGLLPTVFKYTNEFAIVKEAVRASGSELTHEPFVQMYNSGESVFAVMRQDAMDRFERARSGMLFWGQENDNVTVSGATSDTVLGYDTAITWTEGFMPFQAGNAYQNTYNPAAYTLDEIDEIAANYEAENLGTRTICSLQGHQYSYIIQNALSDLFDSSLSNAMIVSSLSGYNLSLDDWQPVIEDKDFMAWLGWQGVRRSNFLFHFRMMHEFVAADGGGAAAYSYPYDAVYVPLTMERDVRTGVQRPSMGYHWKQLGNYSRKMVFGTLAGAGAGGNGGYVPAAVNEYDSVTSFMVCEHAFHGACPNKIQYHTQAS